MIPPVQQSFPYNLSVPNAACNGNMHPFPALPSAAMSAMSSVQNPMLINNVPLPLNVSQAIDGGCSNFPLTPLPLQLPSLNGSFASSPGSDGSSVSNPSIPSIPTLPTIPNIPTISSIPTVPALPLLSNTTGNMNNMN